MGSLLDIDDVVSGHPEAEKELTRLRAENQRYQQWISAIQKYESWKNENTLLREEVARLKNDRQG